MPPFWLWVLALVFLGVAALCALVISLDVLLGHRQPMAVMNVVWPITALYFGLVGLLAYWKLGRAPLRARQGQMALPMEMAKAQHEMAMPMDREMAPSPPAARSAEKPFWQRVFVSDSHCGAGCTLGDILGEWIIFLFAITLFGQMLWSEYLLDFLLAYLLGILFQFWAIVPMRRLAFRAGLWASIKADTISLTFFEIGLFGWMAISHFLLFPRLLPNNPAYWFMMQIGMMLGFLTSYPVNWALVRAGIKEAM
jgi:hypothetical protein